MTRELFAKFNSIFQAQEEAEARDLGIGLLRTPDELSDGEKGIVMLL